MRELSRFATGMVLAAGLAAVAYSPALADTDRTDCMGNNCVRVHCYDDTGTCTRTTNFQTRDETDRTYSRTTYAVPRQPLRYACDDEGDNCHWTRSYFLNDDGTPIFDPGVSY